MRVPVVACGHDGDEDGAPHVGVHAVRAGQCAQVDASVFGIGYGDIIGL